MRKLPLPFWLPPLILIVSGTILATSLILVQLHLQGHVKDWMRYISTILTRLYSTIGQQSHRPAHTMASDSTSVHYLGQEDAIQLDVDLMTEYKFTLEQLMELAGLSVAHAAYRVYGQTYKSSPVLAVAGPGNNGGDAMVAVRHMKLFGFENVTLLNTRRPTKEFFQALIAQAEASGVHIAYDPAPFLDKHNAPSLVIDGLFGFSFKPPVRPDMEPFLQLLSTAPTLLSIDIPSGWDVEKGPPSEKTDAQVSTLTVIPDTLVSLSAPKKCATFFKGLHFLGGRFLPPKLVEKYALNLPSYEGTDCILQL